MKSTREKILRFLLAYPQSPINDLAEAVGINGISVRHHLTALAAEDMVISAEERHGVGRPRLVYSLTQKGIETFPTNYLKLTQRILSTLKHKLSHHELNELFIEIGTQIADAYDKDMQGKTLDERLLLIKNVLDDEGFIIEISKDQETCTISSLSCPYYRIGLDFPDVCVIDHTLISQLAGTTVEVQSCMYDGSERCVYTIPIQSEVKNDRHK